MVRWVTLMPKGQKPQQTQKSRGMTAAFLAQRLVWLSLGVNGPDFCSLKAFLTLFDYELDTLAFTKGLEAGTNDVPEVGEKIRAASILSNKAVALTFIEPLHNSGLRRHGKISYLLYLKITKLGFIHLLLGFGHWRGSFNESAKNSTH